MTKLGTLDYIIYLIVKSSKRNSTLFALLTGAFFYIFFNFFYIIEISYETSFSTNFYLIFLFLFIWIYFRGLFILLFKLNKIKKTQSEIYTEYFVRKNSFFFLLLFMFLYLIFK